jgi:hypothetical protein
MNWIELRQTLRKQYGNEFSFFNDKYRNGTRRVKIYGVDPNEMKQFIREQYPNLEVNDYDWVQGMSCGVVKSVTIHFSE